MALAAPARRPVVRAPASIGGAVRLRRGDAPAGDAPPHALPVADVFAAFHTSPRGLTGADAASRLASAGPNVIREVHGRPLALRFAANFTHLMALLLWIGGAIAFVARLPQLGVAIWAVNLINGAFSFWQEYKAEKATAALRRLLPRTARVIRDAREQRVPAETLVPGDLLLLEAGDRVSADARLIEDAELQVDQSTLTGESRPTHKVSRPVLETGGARAELPNLVFSGTCVAAGSGRAVVVATGMATEFGRIAHLTQTVGESPSPLQKELANVTRAVSAVAVASGVLFFVLAVALAGVDLAESFVFAMGMIVAFVPEGLLPTVTLALAMAVQRMVRRHALVKRLSAVETLGCTSVICTDKTGTLTQNEMTVRGLWMPAPARDGAPPGRWLTVGGAGYESTGALEQEGAPLATVDGDLALLLAAGALCTNARLLPPNAEACHWTVLGDPTEAALQVVARKGGLDLEQLLAQSPRLAELPFDSQRKRMSTLHALVEGTRRLYVKGAPRELLELCATYRSAGRDVPLDGAVRAAALDANDRFARDGLRLLAVACRDVAAAPGPLDAAAAERDLTLLGLAAMMDPPRPEVEAAVATCHRAGIRVVMITGDYGLTAESVARRIGIVRGDRPRIVTGRELESLDDDGLRSALAGEVLFARVSPEHKLRIVAALQAQGHVVAVTGDGVNDAPALKKADIGVAMGVAGTDVAKEAADMVLTDDNFASIVSAVEEGRAVYANVKKFICYIFTSNTPEAIPFVLFALSRGRIPLALTVMQILSIDLGTDMVPALALGAEPAEPGVMDRPPRRPDQHVITPALMRRAYLWLGGVQSLAAMTAFYFHFWVSGYWGQWFDLPASGSLYASATAMTLGAVVTTQIGNLFAQRTESASFFKTSLFANRLLWFGIASELVVVAAVIYAPPLQWVFGTAPFAPAHWLFLFAWTPALVLVDEVRKALVRRAERAMTRVPKGVTP
ncbi:MAG TPA: cation-transporting P-type ATPase [Chloroflexota bacterium]|nr:cation-transporting P-type ATPase [Chloroflexota bacterium]